MFYQFLIQLLVMFGFIDTVANRYVGLLYTTNDCKLCGSWYSLFAFIVGY